jgi:hypothetical protein
MESNMPMELFETKILPNAVYMKFVDDPDPQKMDYWIEFQVPLDELKHPQTANDLGDPELQFLSEIRLAALRYAREVIGDETQRLSQLAGRIR